MKNVLLVFPALLLVAACGSDLSTEDVLRNHGYSETYVSGYHSGCASGKHAGGDLFSKRAQDTAAYSAGGDYRTGWDYGFMSCKQQQIQDLEVAMAAGLAASVAISTAHGADGVDARKALEGVDTSAIQAAGW